MSTTVGSGDSLKLVCHLSVGVDVDGARLHLNVRLNKVSSQQNSSVFTNTVFCGVQ